MPSTASRAFQRHLERYVAMVIIAAFTAIACSPAQQSVVDPALVIQDFYTAIEHKDISAAMSFIADNAVFRAAPKGVYNGEQAVREWVQDQIDNYPESELSEVHVAGNKVTWHVELFKDGVLVSRPNGQAVVNGGKIESLLYLANPVPPAP